MVGNPNSLLNLKIITVFYGDSPFVITSSFSFYFSISLASLFFHCIVESHRFFIFFWELVWFGVGFGSNGGAVYTKSYAFCCKATRLPLGWKWKCFVFRRQVLGFVIFGRECALLDQTYLAKLFCDILEKKNLTTISKARRWCIRIVLHSQIHFMSLMCSSIHLLVESLIFIVWYCLLRWRGFFVSLNY